MGIDCDCLVFAFAKALLITRHQNVEFALLNANVRREILLTTQDLLPSKTFSFPHELWLLSVAEGQYFEN